MNNLKIEIKISSERPDDRSQRGSAMIIALFVLLLVSAFVALALTRSASEAAAVGNETGETRTFYAAQGSLEMMTRNFNKVFEVKLNPLDADFDRVRTPVNGVPGLAAPQFIFNQEVDKTSDSTVTVIEDGAFAGLYATRDNWRLRTTATDINGRQVQLTRNILNNRIPIFQFGIFYNDDLEIHPGARFDFGGRVHSNGSLFLMSGAGLYFNSRVSSVGEVITDTGRNGKPSIGNWGENVFIKNNGTNVQLKANMGSVLKSPVNGNPVFQDQANKPKYYNPDMPELYESTSWTANQATFGGNLLARQKPLDLPLKIASSTNGGNDALDYIELIKRGKNVGDLYNAGGTPTSPVISPVTAANADTDVTASERYADKTGIRVSLSDSKAKLPGCAASTGTSVTTVCGKRLDGDALGDSEAAVPTGTVRGYQPLPMLPTTANYTATKLNGDRFGTSGGNSSTRQVWIKIELVSRDPVSNAIVTKDVTADILSLGVTEPAPCIAAKFALQVTNYYSGVCNATTTSAPFIDSRSIIKLQRFVMPGEDFVGPSSSTSFMKFYAGWNASFTGYNLVQTDDLCTNSSPTVTTNCTAVNNGFADDPGQKKTVTINNLPTYGRIVPFPIEMFDSREGIYNADSSVLNTGTTYGAKVPWAGVMSLVDIDVTNLKRFLSSDSSVNFDSNMPTTTDYYSKTSHVLRNSDVPQNSGWVVYVSDRRGDGDFDGEYDMEDIYGNNDGILQPGENVNNSLTTNANGGLDTNYTNEGVKYTLDGLFNPSLPFTYTAFNTSSSYVLPGLAASFDHPYYRRGVRLINGQILPGTYDYANAANTRGFSFASENGVYVLGNYNARAISTFGTPTAAESYLPQGRVDSGGVTTNPGTSDGENQVPASIAADAVTILSNSWNDSKSFAYPFDITGGKRKATETYTRFAMLAGDARSSFLATPNQGTNDARLGGGVHNFKRFLEDWGGTRLNYCGSLINLFNARNNNGSYKNANGVYSAPFRDWIFDASFLDPARLPPGTPYFQYIQTTGFQRTNE